MITKLVGATRAHTSIQSAWDAFVSEHPVSLSDNAEIIVDPETFIRSGTGHMVIASGLTIPSGRRLTFKEAGALRSTTLDAQLANNGFFSVASSRVTIRGFNCINGAESGNGIIGPVTGGIVEDLAMDQGFNADGVVTGSATLAEPLILRNLYLRGRASGGVSGGIAMRGISVAGDYVKILGCTIRRRQIGIQLGTSQVGLEIRNVIMQDVSDSGGDASKFWISVIGGPVPADILLSNNLYGNIGNAVWRENSTNHATLSAWQTATGKDANSFSATDPLLTSLTDPHIPVTSPAWVTGIANANLTEDFDGAVRTTPPSIGCDDPPLSVSSITPKIGSNKVATPLVTQIVGSNFHSGAIVKLTAAGAPDITASPVVVNSQLSITATFALLDKTSGPYAVSVT